MTVTDIEKALDSYRTLKWAPDRPRKMQAMAYFIDKVDWDRMFVLAKKGLAVEMAQENGIKVKSMRYERNEQGQQTEAGE